MADEMVSVEVDPAQLRRFMAEVKEFDPNLAKALRKNLRVIGQKVAAEIQAEVRRAPSRGARSRRPHNTRAEIASGIGTKVSTAAKKQGVFVTGSSKAMSPGRAAMPRALNKSTFRHPVFGSRRYVSQRGNPYFGSTIKRFEAEAKQTIQDALNEAAKQVQTGRAT